MFRRWPGFVLFAHARSGSSNLKNALNSQGRVRVFGEPFNPDVTREYLNIAGESPVPAVAALLFSRYAGIKTLFHQLSPAGNAYLIANHKTVFLRRNNLLQAAVSAVLSRHTGVWNRSERPGLEPRELYADLPPIDPEEVAARLAEFSAGVKFYEQHLRPDAYLVEYEQLFGPDQPRVMREIFDYAGVPLSDPPAAAGWLAPDQKLNDNSVYEMIPNISEIRRLGSPSVGFL